MRQRSKKRGLRDIVTAIVMMASITMPLHAWSQPLTPAKEWVVVIDAGHGGRDPGAHGAKAKEKNINLAVALKTGKYISEYFKDVKVIYTRDDDTYPGLEERANVANKNKADIFISIHSNWWSDQRVTGAETYVLGQSMDEANLRVAMKENSVITFEENYETKYEGYDPNSVESFIIFSLMQNTYLKQSTEFASLIQKQFKERVGRKDRGVRQAGLIVLWRATMPSVLVELGYISNSEEEKFLMSDQGQDYLASAIFRAFRDYKESIDSRSGIKNGNAVLTAVQKPAGSGNNTATGNKDSSATSGSPVREQATVQPEKDSVRPTTVPGKDIPSGDRQVNSSPAVPQNHSVVSQGVPQSPAKQVDDILFMVQISAMPKNREMTPDLLNGIDKVTKIDAGERVKYAAGSFRVYDDALQYRRTLTARFPDAFVIAVRNGRIMPLREAIDKKRK